MSMEGKRNISNFMIKKYKHFMETFQQYKNTIHTNKPIIKHILLKVMTETCVLDIFRLLWTKLHTHFCTCPDLTLHKYFGKFC